MREAPFLNVVGTGSDNEELLAVGWRCQQNPSEVCLVFARYGKEGFRPLGRGNVDQQLFDLGRIDAEKVTPTFLDSNNKTVLFSDQFFSSLNQERNAYRETTASLPDPRDAETIGRNMERNLQRALVHRVIQKIHSVS